MRHTDRVQLLKQKLINQVIKLLKRKLIHQGYKIHILFD